jgi:hypothetical protein
VLGAGPLNVAFGASPFIEKDIRDASLSIVNNRYQLLNDAEGKETLLYALNCVAISCSYDIGRVVAPLIDQQLRQPGVSPTTGIYTPFELVYTAKRLGMMLAWLDQMIRLAVSEEAARIAQAKTAWETEAGLLASIVTLPVPPGLGIVVGAELGVLISTLSERFDRQFDSYEAAINEFKRSCSLIGRSFVDETIKAIVPEGEIVPASVGAFINQFEANALRGADQERKFLDAVVTV